MKQKLLLKTMLLLCALIAGSSSVWATDPTVLFHETFGNNENNARAWDDSYSVKSGVAAVYSGVTGYTVSNAKQGKNTTGYTQSGLNQTTQGTDASIIIGPLNVANYNTLKLTYQWKAASVKGTYSTSLYYKTSSEGSFTAVSGTGTGATSFVERSYSLPAAAQVSTLYLKIVWNTSNTQAIIDEVDLSGFVSGGDPSINASSNVDVAYNATSGEFDYSIINPVAATDLTASVTAGGTWLSNASVDAVNGKVTFTTTENEDEENARVGTIHLVYGSNLATKDVTITQAKSPVKYTVTIDEPTGGTLVVKNGETVIASGTKVANGTELTIIPTPNENYKYVNWQYKAGNGSWTTKTTTYNYTVNGKNVEIRANFALTYPVNWSVNGEVVATTRFAENDYITFPDDPADIVGFTFVGWVNAAIAGTTDDKPAFLTTPQMGTSELTYYAVYAKSDNAGVSIERKIQTLEYDTWTYSGTTTDKNSYRMFGNNSYVESAAFDLSNLSKVIVYGGTFGGSSYKNLTIGDGTNVWKNVEVSGDSQTGVNTYTDGTALSGIKSLRIISNSGDGSNNGVRISKVEIFTSCKYSSFRTTVPTTATITLNDACTDGALVYGTYSNSQAFVVSDDIEVSEVSVVDGKLYVESYDPGDVVPANTGVMVSALVGGNYDVNLSSEAGTSVLGSDNLLKPSGDAGINAAAMGTAAPSCKYYRLTMHNGTQIGFWWGAASGAAFDLAANKAYLAVPTGADAPSLLWFDNGSTGIDEVRGQTEEVRGEYYNLSGQRVANPTKGLYIVNGRKVVIK